MARKGRFWSSVVVRIGSVRVPDVPPVSFVALIPLESILQFGGLQMMAYLGVRLGDLLIVTLCKFVMALLPRIVLTPQQHCRGHSRYHFISQLRD